MAIHYERAKFCNEAVKKACGKKKPEIQKTIGVPLSYQFYKKPIRSFMSSIQEASGFIDKKPIAAQYLGT